jgi:hypothetical protein
VKKTSAPGDGEGDEGEEFLPFGRPTDDQSTRRDTSDKAFARADLSEQREALLRAIKRTPRTCDEIMSLGWAHQSASAGINWLMRQGHIVDSGIRRKTSMGRKAIVWRYEPNPVPLKRTRPTRRELEMRIETAVKTIDRNHSDMTYLRHILTGEVTP